MRILKKFTFVCIAAMVLLAVSACNGVSNKTAVIEGDGNIVSVERELNIETVYKLIIEDISFEEIADASIKISESGGSAVLRADGNIADTITVTVSSSTITIKGDKAKKYRYTSFDITIGAAVNDLQVNGAFSADIDVPSVTEFTAVSNGVLNGEMRFGELDTFSFISNGAGSVSASGSVREAAFELNGAGSINAFELHALTADVKISGAGNCGVYVSQTLNAIISGMGSVTFDGNPENVNESISGLGSVKARN